MSPEILDKSKKPAGNLYRYPAGTIIEIHDGHLRYWLVAFTKFDSDLHASVTKSEYLSCMLSILNYAKKKSQGFPIYLPLIGGGHSSAYQNEQEILTFMIEWFKLNKDEVNCDINIVVDGRARDRISILKRGRLKWINLKLSNLYLFLLVLKLVESTIKSGIEFLN